MTGGNMRYIEINQTGAEMSSEIRNVAAELMARYIRRGALTKYSNLEFRVGDCSVELGAWRNERFCVCEEWNSDAGFRSIPFCWY